MSATTSGILNKTFGNSLPEQALVQLREKAVARSYPAGHILCLQGDRGDTFFVLVEGRVLASQRLEDGEDRLLSVLEPGQFFGELALLDNTPRMATCTAATPVTVLEIDEGTFDRLVEEVPAIAYRVTLRVVQMTRTIDQHAIEDLQAKNRQLRQAYDDLRAAQAELIEMERLEHELSLAAEMQRSLLPGALPQFAGHKFAAFLQPARQVGGDFYDVILLDDEHVGLLLADVADKGMHAALFMAVTRTLFQQEAHHALSPAAVALAVHAGMREIAPDNDIFVTAFYGILHRPSGRLTYVRAAQERPLLARPGQPVQTLPGDGRFLGMLPDLTLEESAVTLERGDRLVVFSDGVPDAVNPAGERYAYARLHALVEANAHLPADALRDAIVADVAAFTRDADAFDDLTLLVTAVV